MTTTHQPAYIRTLPLSLPLSPLSLPLSLLLSLSLSLQLSSPLSLPLSLPHGQFGKRLKLGNHDGSTCQTMFADLLQFGAPKSGDELDDLGSSLTARRKDRMIFTVSRMRALLSCHHLRSCV